MSELKTVVILNCHYNHFRAHPGWWAIQSSPNLQKGEEFQFALNNDNQREGAVCRLLIHPGQNLSRQHLEGLFPDAQEFRDWFVIVYGRELEEKITEAK